MRDLPMRPELLAGLREGKPAATNELYREHVRRLDKWLANRHPGLPSAADHADAVQETFTRAFKREARLAYDGKRDFWSYLVGIASNVVADFWRKRGREVPMSGRDSSDPTDALARAADPDGEESPAHGWLDRKARSIVRQYASGLSEEPLRSVYDAIFERGVTLRDTAAELGLHPSSVQRLVERLRREVRALLEQAGIRDSNPSAA